MINTSDRPVPLLGTLELHQATQEAIATAIRLLELQFEHSTLARAQNRVFFQTFNTYNHVEGVLFDADFVDACFDTHLADSRNTAGNSARLTLKAYFVEFKVPAPSLSALRRGIKLLLVELWRSKAILLPTTFNPGPSFPAELFDNQLLQWLRSIEPDGPGEVSVSTDNRRLRYYGPRLLFTTDWTTPSDISLSELSTLHRAYRLYVTQASSTVIAAGSQLPFSILATRALSRFPDEVQFSAQDLARYTRWSRSLAAQMAFENYVEPRSGRTTSGYVTRARARTDVQPRPGQSRQELEVDGHEALRSAFVNRSQRGLSHVDWIGSDELSYQGREHVDLSSLTPKWLEAMRAYMHHRRFAKGYRSDTGVKGALSLLRDYLFLYLPWWCELAQQSKVSVPRSPKELSRFGFITRHSQESVDEFPETLLTVAGWRMQSKASVGVAVRGLSKFFDFVQLHFSDDESVAGSSFKNPINQEFDAPRTKRPNKTDKVIIPRRVYSHLLFYCYALEEAGMKLEELALSGKLNTTHRARLVSPTLNLSQLGVGGVGVMHRTNFFPLNEIPNVFEWHKRHLKATESQGCRTALLPHCTALRLLTTSVETGLRCQSAQWLDRRAWRQLASNEAPDNYTFELFVNTDKTKEEPWTAVAVHRVREMLQRQEEFQDRFEDADAYAPVLYEGVESPFAPIEPLFRQAKGANPVSDTLYNGKWQRLMVGFEAYYRAATGERHVEFFTLAPTLTREGKTIVREVSRAEGGRGVLYCPISTLAIHTPHSCRATFATNRSGILSIPETAELLGHEDEVTTAHYTKPSIEDLHERLKESDIAQNQDFLQFDENSGVQLRADRPDSALVRSFNENRAETIKTFRFMPGVRIWSTEEYEGPDEGLRLLREGPMSRIRFRETHVCPVGEECPSDIIEKIGEPRRCGCCPLSLKCIDHLPAIAAKQNLLLERVRFKHGLHKRLEAKGEPIAVLDQLWDELELDANEYAGWQLSSQKLTNLPPLSKSTELQFIVEEPDIVKSHLVRVTRTTDTATFILQRIADCNAYPSMTTPQVEIAASQVKRRLLAGKIDQNVVLSDDISFDISDAAALLSVMMKATGLPLEEVSRKLQDTKSNSKSLVLETS